jgi:integrase
VRTKSTRTVNKRIALNFAKDFYEKLVAEYYSNSEKFSENPNSLRYFEVIAERSITIESDRVRRKELSQATHKNNIYRLRRIWIAEFAKRDITNISHYDIVKVVSKLTDKGISTVAISQYLQCLRNVFNLAAAEKLITNIPVFPKIKKTSMPRGGFSLAEYKILVRAANKLANNSTPPLAQNHKHKANGIFQKTNAVPWEMRWLIRFMVNSFVRPSDVIKIQHKHIEVIKAESVYLRLTLPETKKHSSQIVTLRPAVHIYESLKKYAQKNEYAAPEDFLFMPEVKIRSKAGWLLNHHFQKILSEAKLGIGTLGQKRSLYSLRHTSIMFRLLYGQGIDLLTLARNARTSVQMIEKFYASNLTAEMNVNLLQSKRTGRNVV